MPPDPKDQPFQITVNRRTWGCGCWPAAIIALTLLAGLLAAARWC